MEHRFSGILLEHDMGHGRKRLMVVDADTGEKHGEIWRCDHETVRGSGASAMVTLCVLSWEKSEIDGSEHRYVSLYEPGINTPYWLSGRADRRVNAIPRHSGGKPGFVKLYKQTVLKAMDAVGNAEWKTWCRMLLFADWRDGGVVKKPRKRGITDASTLAEMFGYSERTMKSHLDALMQAGLITQDAEGRYVIKRDAANS